MTLPLFLGVSHISLKWTFFLSMHKFCIFMHCQYAKMFFKMFTNFVAPAKCKLGRRGHDWNIAKIAKYALHKLLGKLSLHISFICPVCPTFTASGCPYIRSVDLKDHVIHLLQGKSHFPFQFEWKKASAVMAIVYNIVYNRAPNICPSPNFSASGTCASSATLVGRLGKDVVTQEVVQRLEPATTALELCCRIAIAARR